MPKPSKPRKSIEHAMQVEFFRWTLEARKEYPQLNLMFAIPNGGKRDWSTAKGDAE